MSRNVARPVSKLAERSGGNTTPLCRFGLKNRARQRIA